MIMVDGGRFRPLVQYKTSRQTSPDSLYVCVPRPQTDGSCVKHEAVSPHPTRHFLLFCLQRSRCPFRLNRLRRLGRLNKHMYKWTKRTTTPRCSWQACQTPPAASLIEFILGQLRLYSTPFPLVVFPDSDSSVDVHLLVLCFRHCSCCSCCEDD